MRGMKQRDTPAQNPESGKGVAKQTSSKFSALFWQERVFRPTYTRDGKRLKVAQWYARIKHGGRRESVGLGTNGREEAGRKAVRLYQLIRSKGWDAAMAEFRPDAEPRCMTTIGDYLVAVRPILSVRDRSWANYTYALRKIGLEAAGARDKKPEKFSPTLIWRNRADKLPLEKLTPLAVEQWQRDFVKQAGKNHVLLQRARRSANSYVRNARALFSRKVLKRLRELSVALPSPLPFDGVTLEPQGSTRYVSQIDAGELFKLARAKLAKKHPESWKVILLAMGAGLRRSEIDGLCWTQIDFDKGEIRILNHEHFEAKTADSQDSVFVDAGLLAQLKASRDEASLFVVQPKTPAVERGGQYYRCQETFEHVTSWLRKHGVKDDKPLHALRKEFGSIITATADIHTASRQLRHSNISTTANYYADNRRRATVEVGELLKAKTAR